MDWRLPRTRRKLTDVDRLERQHWCLRVPLVGLTDAAGPLDELQWMAEIKVEAFAALVREEVERAAASSKDWPGWSTVRADEHRRRQKAPAICVL